MNFTKWLLKRMHRKVFGDEWGWLYKYREAIREAMPIAILATIFCGLLWCMVMGLIFLYFIENRETLQLAMKCMLACPPLFFFYNWFYTLYEIYDAERLAAWDAVRKPE
jgi:hypothetical protein